MEQRSPEWYAARLGRVTASRIADLMATTKSGPSASRKNYAAQLVVERLTGQPTETYQNEAMRWGVETEDQARASYEFATFRVVEDVGFVDHPSIPMAGASPDGLIGADGLLELKCPTSATHIETLLGATVPDRYIKQIQFQMACTGRKWCDFVSFDPRLPDEMQLWRMRVERDGDAIAEIEDAVRAFLAEVDDTESRLRARYAAEAA